MGEGGIGVLLVGFGGPISLDQVPAFVTSVLGRQPPPAVIDAAAARYAAIGGGSPLPAMTRRQGKLLAAELRRRRLDWPVAVAMVHAAPGIGDAVEQLVAQGVGEIVALSLTPYRSRVSSDAYEAAVNETLRQRDVPIPVSYPGDWNLDPGYLKALVDTLATTRSPVPEAPVIFSAHSLPRRMIEAGDPYADQLAATADAVAARAGLGEWHLAYQSVSAVADEPWLGPPVEQVLDQLAAEGKQSVVVDPIGFLADHVETLYDNDIEHRAHAKQLGLAFYRCRCLNDHPRLIAVLADVTMAAAGK